MKARAIDKYIRRATAGLPHLERIDTAAEIRVNLNQKIKELMLEGHPKEEAEFLAIKDMGDAFSTNRALLGHAFTHRLGWALVVVTVLGLSSWWLWQNWWNVFWVSTRVVQQELSGTDIDRTLQNPLFVERGNYQKFNFFLPRGTRTLEVVFVTPEKSAYFAGVLRTLEHIRKNPDLHAVPTEIIMNIATGIDKVSLETGKETHSIHSFFNQRDYGNQFYSVGNFDMTSYIGMNSWVQFPKGYGVSLKSKYLLNQMSLSGHESNQTDLRLNQWFNVVKYGISAQGYPFGKSKNKPTAVVAVLIRASSKEANQLKITRLKMERRHPNSFPDSFFDDTGKPVVVQ